MDREEQAYVLGRLRSNRDVIEHLLRGTIAEEVTWRPAADQWCLLEILCHLVDEERDDFRARVASVLQDPSVPLPKTDPPGWVTERRYMERDFEERLHAFLAERDHSLVWLDELTDPQWDNAFQHPEYGPLPASMFLVTWAAHDYLHIRQIIRVRFQYLANRTGDSLAYAGEW